MANGVKQPTPGGDSRPSPNGLKTMLLFKIELSVFLSDCTIPETLYVMADSSIDAIVKARQFGQSKYNACVYENVWVDSIKALQVIQ